MVKNGRREKNMTEEEKKAVEFVKERTKELKKYAKREDDLVYDDIILNLINKLQKENEELKNQEAIQRKMNEEENSIEKDIEIIEDFILKTDVDYSEYNEQIVGDISYQAIQHLLSAYQEVLKESEELKIKNNAIKRESEAYAEHMIRLDNELNLEKEKSKYEWIRQNCLPQELVNKLYIPIQKVKDIIDRIDYDIKKTKEIISKNTNIYASYRKNDYQIVRLRAMNTKSLDIKKRLQKLLESEE